MTEGELVDRVASDLRKSLPASLVVVQGAPLLYQVRVDNTLSVTVDPKAPVRGQSAFETDLCVFQKRKGNVQIPRVVLEFKLNLSTHDVLTYSQKARKHKGIYPYLRYGLVVARPSVIPGRFFTHNEALDFCLALGTLRRSGQLAALSDLVKKEVKASSRLEAMAFGHKSAYLYRTEVRLRQ